MAPFFTLFGRTVGSYGLCSVFGLLVSSFVAIRLGRRQGFPIYPVIQAAVAALVGLLAGGHLLYGLLHLPGLLAQPAPIMFLRCFSGSVYYGGFLGAWFCVHWYAHRFAPNQCEAHRSICLLCPPIPRLWPDRMFSGWLLLWHPLPMGLYR